MAGLTDDQRKALLILKVGEVAGGLLAANIDLLWDEHEALASNPALRDLYVKRGLLEIALGTVRGAVDFTDGDHTQKASQRTAALLKMLDTTDAAIAAIEDGIGVPAGAAIGELTTTAPESPPRAPLYRPFGPDATDPPYWGSPYFPQRERRVRP